MKQVNRPLIIVQNTTTLLKQLAAFLGGIADPVHIMVFFLPFRVSSIWLWLEEHEGSI